jgi:predicted transcriptional regulator
MTRYQLTRCELEVMDVLWERGRCTVQDVCDALERPLAYTTVMTTLNILQSKRRVLKRIKVSRAFVYEPIVKRDEVCKSVAADLKQHLVKGSVKSLVLNLIEDQPMSPGEIAEIKAAIERLEAQG